MAGKWREGKWPEENTAVVQTKGVLETNVRAGGFNVPLAGKMMTDPRSQGPGDSWTLKIGMTIALFMSPAIGISQCGVSPAPTANICLLSISLQPVTF